MLKRLSPKLTGGLVVLAALLGATEGHAGYTHQSASCFKNADGSGECRGTFAGFRASPNPGDYAYFQYNSTPGYVTYAFYATYNGVFYMCAPNATLVSMWDVIQNNRGYFNISWNASGTCTNIWINNGSYTQTF